MVLVSHWVLRLLVSRRAGAVSRLLRGVEDDSQHACARERTLRWVLHHPGGGDMSLTDGFHLSVGGAHPSGAGDELADDAGSDAGMSIHTFPGLSLWPNSIAMHILGVE